jgi:hypothetical protein
MAMMPDHRDVADRIVAAGWLVIPVIVALYTITRAK